MALSHFSHYIAVPKHAPSAQEETGAFPKRKWSLVLQQEGWRSTSSFKHHWGRAALSVGDGEAAILAQGGRTSGMPIAT